MKDYKLVRSECESCPFDAYHYTLDGYHACTQVQPPVPVPEEILDLLDHKEAVSCRKYRRGVLYADTREKSAVLSYVESRCEKKDLRLEIVQLPTGFGDYYFEFVDEDKRLLSSGFERKTFEDFYRSIINGSLTIQVQSLVDNVDFPFLMLSGSLDVVDYTHYELVLATIGAMGAEYGLTVISNMTDAQLATVLVSTVENLHLNKHRISIRARRKEIDLRTQFLINAFEGVGKKTAELLLEEFGSIDDILTTLIQTPIVFAEKVKGISTKKSEHFRDIVTSSEAVIRDVKNKEKRKSSPSKRRKKRRFSKKKSK